MPRDVWIEGGSISSLRTDVQEAGPQAASLSLKRSQMTHRGMCYLQLVLVLEITGILFLWEDTFMVQS